MKKLNIIYLIIFVLTLNHLELLAQEGNNGSNGEPLTYHEKMISAQAYWDNQIAIYGSEDSLIQVTKDYKRFISQRNFYLDRVGSGESIEDYEESLKLFFQTPLNNYPNNSSWYELGPKTNGYVGPINFITLDPSNNNRMFAGGEHGGLFISEDSGDNWINAGTDHLSSSISAADAQFSPDDPSNTWFFMDGNGESENLEKNGYTNEPILLQPPVSVHKPGISGIYRTTDAGTTWTLIGNKDSLYTSKLSSLEEDRGWGMKKMLILPHQGDDNLTIYLTTSIGIMRTTNALDDVVIWEKVFSIDDYSTNLFEGEGIDETLFTEKQLCGYKIFWVPNSNLPGGGLLVGSITKAMKHENFSWPHVNHELLYQSYLIHSETGDSASWTEWKVPIPNENNQPTYEDNPNDPDYDPLLNDTFRPYRTDITFSNRTGNIENIYLFNKTAEKQYSDYSILKWSVIDKDTVETLFSSDTETDYLSDNAYSCIAVDANESTIVYSSRNWFRKISLNNQWANETTIFGSGQNSLHMDIEDLVFKSNGELYVATHGGVHKNSNTTLTSYLPKNVGLGVAEVSGFSTSFSNPETIAVGLWHDLTQATGNTIYTDNWTTDWLMFPEIGDAFDPDINYSDNSIIYAKDSNHGYTSAHFNFPTTVGTGSTHKPLSSGDNDNYSRISGTEINYFNHNTVYTNWSYSPSAPCDTCPKPPKRAWVYRHSNQGGYYNSTDWRRLFVLRDENYTHPIITEYVNQNFNESADSISLRSKAVFTSKTNKNLLFSDFSIKNKNLLAITNKAQFGIDGIQNTIADTIMVDTMNNSWTLIDFSNQNNEISYGGLNEIHSDPLNPNVFYVLPSYYKEIYRYTYNGDILTGDIDANNFEIEKIEFPNINTDAMYILPGTRDLFIGTDMGVYHASLDVIDTYLENGDEVPVNEVWTRYGPNFPNVITREIEPNFVADKLRAATFGRGVWEIPLPCDKLDYAHVINTGEDVTINNYARFRQDVIVEDGATLTLTPQAKVYFAEHCALIVKPGGELIVDGAFLSNACGDALWLGISVEGNANLSQTSANQGKVTVKNGATIENAHTGVWLRANTEECTEILNSGGGMVFARNSTFKNCYVGIEFSPYRDFFSNNNPKANRSRIRECHFLTTRTLNGGFEAKAGISLKEINKLYIRGNTFENTKVVGQNHPDYTGIGILSANSTFKAYDYCSVSLPYGTPCPEGDIVRNTFINLVHGVRAYAWDEINTFTVDNALFDKCAYGLFAKKVHYAKITKCEFDVSPDPTTVGSLQWTPYGTHLLGCGSYEVEENKFYSDDNSYERVGIVIENSFDISNEIYKNEFNQLFVGSLAQGDNQVYSNEDEGLEMLCGKYGENDANNYDIAFTDESHVAQLQGNNSFGDIYSPYNKMFVNSCINDNNFHVDEDSQWFVYFYRGSGEYDFENLEDCYNELLLIDNSIGNIIPYQEACPSNFSSSGDVIVKKELVEAKRVEIIDVKSELSTLANGGEDEQLLVNTIKNSSNSSLVVRNMLYPLSPNLTDPVLIEIIKRSPTMNEWHLTELLIGNSPLRLSVLEEYYLQDPLPDFLHTLLMNYQAGETNLAALKKELKSKETTKNRAEGDYIRRMIMDLEETVDYEKIEELLAQEEDNQSLKVKIDLASAKGDYVTAQSYLDLYQPTSNEDAYVAYQSTLLEIKEQPNSFCELSGSQKSNLESIVNNNKEQRYAAENILEYTENQLFDEFIVLPTAGNKSMKVVKDRERSEIPLLNSYPNPAVDEVYFTFSNQKNLEQAILTIYNSEGKTMQVFDMSKYKGIIQVPIKDWASGVYFSKLAINGLKISESKFTKL